LCECADNCSAVSCDNNTNVLFFGDTLDINLAT